MAGSIGAIALKRSGFLKAIFRDPYPPIEIPVMTVPSLSNLVLKLSAAHFGSSSTTNCSHFPPYQLTGPEENDTITNGGMSPFSQRDSQTFIESNKSLLSPPPP